MLQIALITHQHDHNIAIRMLPQLVQPSPDVHERLLLADIVYEQGTNGTTIVGRSDGAVALLTSSVPDLCLDGLRVDLNASCGKFYADRGLGVEVEFVARKAAEQVGFTNA